GSMEAVITELGVYRLSFTGTQAAQTRPSDFLPANSSSAGEHPLSRQLQEELLEYCDGIRRSFSLPLHLDGTDFQKAVWRRLRTIPYGKTVSYKEIADELKRAHGSRAVGRAVGQNPVVILVPCHRVIGSSGRLAGFAAGLELKEKLLELEGLRIAFERAATTAG